MITLSKPIQIPKVWKTLLDIPDFEELPEAQYPCKWRDMGDPTTLEHSFDATPYRDDARYAHVEDGNIKVIYTLNSGNGNYWLSCEVFKKEAVSRDFRDAEPIHEDPDSCCELNQDSDEIETIDSTIGTVKVPIVLVESIDMIQAASSTIKR